MSLEKPIMPEDGQEPAGLEEPSELDRKIKEEDRDLGVDDALLEELGIESLDKVDRQELQTLVGVKLRDTLMNLERSDAMQEAPGHLVSDSVSDYGRQIEIIRHNLHTLSRLETTKEEELDDLSRQLKLAKQLNALREDLAEE